MQAEAWQRTSSAAMLWSAPAARDRSGTEPCKSWDPWKPPGGALAMKRAGNSDVQLWGFMEVSWDSNGIYPANPCSKIVGEWLPQEGKSDDFTSWFCQFSSKMYLWWPGSNLVKPTILVIFLLSMGYDRWRIPSPDHIKHPQYQACFSDLQISETSNHGGVWPERGIGLKLMDIYIIIIYNI